MTAIVLGFLVSFITWVFPLLAVALFSYALALHSRESTGAVHLFFAAFAAFCRNLLILIDFGTRSPLAGHHYRLFLDIVLLLALSLAVMGSSAFLSVQGISVSPRRRRTMIAVALAFWLMPAISGIFSALSAIEVLHYAIYSSAVVCLAWVYLTLGAVAAHHFGKIGAKAQKLSSAACVLILLHPILRMYSFRASMIPKSAFWWCIDTLLLGFSTILCGAMVMLVARGARHVELRSLLKTELRVQKIVSKRTIVFIGLGVVVAVMLSLLLIQRSGEELTSAVTKELQHKHVSQLLGLGSKLRDTSKALRSSLAGLAMACIQETGELRCRGEVFDIFLKMANDHFPCNILICDAEGQIIKTDASNDTARVLMNRLEAGFAKAAPPPNSTTVLGPRFLASTDDGDGIVFFQAPVFSSAGHDQPLLNAYLFASAAAVASKHLRGVGPTGSVSLIDASGNVVLSSFSGFASGDIARQLSITSREAKRDLLSRITTTNPGAMVHRTVDSSRLISYCSVYLDESKYYLVASVPWDLVLLSIDSAYLKQYQLLGFIMFLVLFGSITAVYVSTKWGRALERIMLAKTEQLRHEKINLEQAMRSIGNPLIVVNGELDVTYANPEFISAFSVPNGNKCYRTIYDRDQPCDDCLARKAIDTDQVCHAVRLSEDGSDARCFDITASPKRDLEGNVIGSIILLNDVTERNTFDRKIRESEEKYKRLVEASPDMVCIIQSGRLIYANKVLIEKLGFSPRELFSRDFELVTRIVHPDWRQEASRCLDSLKGEKASQETELCLITKVGQELQVLFKGVPITYGGLDAVEVILVDITKLKELHKQLLQAERLASLGELTASIAHELNNKLAPILAYSQMLQERTSDEAVAERLTFIEKCATGAKSVVETLLAFPRTSSSVRKLANLNKILEDTVQLVKYRLDASNIDLIMELDEGLPRTMVDPKQIEQVVLNIVNNAYQAMGERGGTLYIVSFAEDSGIVFQITDTGPGISEADLPRVFEPFFTTKPAGKGTGLGLPCSYGIIKAHDGDLKCTSKLSRGTTFTIKLPIVEGEAEQMPETTDAEMIVSQGEQTSARILVVDDEEMLRGMVNEVLSPDHTVFLAGCGREAIDLLQQETISLIITDLRMPGLDGFALYNWVKENKPGLEKQMLFTTGDIYEPRTREFMRQSDIKCISKPFSVKAFLQQVNSLLTDMPPAAA